MNESMNKDKKEGDMKSQLNLFSGSLVAIASPPHAPPPPPPLTKSWLSFEYLLKVDCLRHSNLLALFWSVFQAGPPACNTFLASALSRLLVPFFRELLELCSSRWVRMQEVAFQKGEGPGGWPGVINLVPEVNRERHLEIWGYWRLWGGGGKSAKVLKQERLYNLTQRWLEISWVLPESN